MKNTAPKFLNGIRAAVAAFRWLFLIALVLTIVKPYLGPSTLTATVLLEKTPAGNDSTTDARLHVSSTRADIALTVSDHGDEQLRQVAREAVFPPMLVACAVGFLLCGLAEKILRNLAKGQLFNRQNIACLRWFTGILIAGTILFRITTAWSNQVFGTYAAAHLTIAGARVLPFAENVRIEELRIAFANADTMVVVLLLLIVWAFKEGASLKQEVDLTV